MNEGLSFIFIIHNIITVFIKGGASIFHPEPLNVGKYGKYDGFHSVTSLTQPFMNAINRKIYGDKKLRIFNY